MQKNEVSTQNKVWQSIVDYAAENKTSISTLRRHIKSNKLVWKLEDGKYFLLGDAKISETELNKMENVSEDSVWTSENNIQTSDEQLTYKLEVLEDMLKKANEEIVELKMLVKIYEEKIYGQFQ